MSDWADPQCRCCECRGICCLIPHPGHSHRMDIESALTVARGWALTEKELVELNGTTSPDDKPEGKS